MFADQMEYLSIHEPCEVQPGLPKETALKELGLSRIWRTMACGTTEDHAVGRHNLPALRKSELHGEALNKERKHR